jgi:hypothetical protein
MRKLLLLLWLATIPNTARHVYYYPAFVQMPNVGIGWYANPRDQVDADKVGAFWWYNSSSFAYLGSRNQAIPMTRPGNMSLITQYIGADYNEFMLVGNEGESGPGAGDNLTPEAMARFVQDVRGLYPAAFLVCLNSYDLDYMTAVIDLLPPGTCEAWGVHVTYLLGQTAVSDWLDGLCTDCEVWVTEIGICGDDPGAYDDLYRMTYEARRDSRVRMIFFYTTTEGNPSCTNGINEAGELTVPGLAFKDAIGAYP